MNCKEANQISIIGFLEEKGMNPVKVTGNSFWYCSPLRNEDEPSFKVDAVLNAWYDFGTGTGGHLLDLVCSMYRCNLSGGITLILGTSTETEILSFQKRELKTNTLTIKQLKPLQSPALTYYLESRKIPLKLGLKYLQEAHYIIGERSYFGIAFKNDLGGYALRNKIFKNCSSPNGITTIPGSNEKINVFEGFMDFLSCLFYCNTDQLNGTTIVLNSLSHLNKLLVVLPKFNNINLFLDNDEAGIKAVTRIQELRPEAINQASIIYPGIKDFNDFINHK